MSEVVSGAAVAEAIERIARTGDGAALYRGLQKILCGIAPAGTDPSALSFFEGRRSLAAELMGLMAKGIEQHGSTEPLVIFQLGRAAGSAERARGAGRRIGPGDPVPGWPADE